jgi:ABC-2 type transport system ATP-binding protein
MTDVSMAMELSGLGKRYGRSWGLQDCSFQLPRGKVAALVGPNGAGKSTLLRMAAGITLPTVGAISVLGYSPQNQAKDLLPRVAYFDQERPLYRSFRVKDMLHVGRGLNPRWDDKQAHQYLETMEIPLDARIGTLSIGQQAEVALTLCLAKRPDLLLLDEPVAALDPLGRQRLMQALLGSVADEGTTVLLSSHVLSDLEMVCDYIVILSASRVQVADDLDHLLASHHLLVGERRAKPHLADGDLIVSTSVTARQSQWLVRSARVLVGTSWEVVEPTLSEVVLGYLGATTDNPGLQRRDGPIVSPDTDLNNGEDRPQ